MNRAVAGAILALVSLLAVGCATALSEAELETRLGQAAQAVPELRGRYRVVPIYAESKMAAWTLLADARSNLDSPLSRRLSQVLASAARRKQGCVVGGPYPALSHQVVLNALSLERSGSLPGLRLLLVGPEPPDEELRGAATRAQVRLYHRELR